MKDLATIVGTICLLSILERVFGRAVAMTFAVTTLAWLVVFFWHVGSEAKADRSAKRRDAKQGSTRRARAAVPQGFAQKGDA